MLQRLLAHPNRKNFEITALVRNAEKAKRLDSEFGVKTVVGALQDLEKLATLAENAHVVFHTVRTDRSAGYHFCEDISTDFARPL